MPTIKIQATISPSGSHMQAVLSINGTPQPVVNIETNNVMTPLAADDSEIRKFAELCLKILGTGRTSSQVKSLLTAGFQVTL